jgi:hypothetical protein
VRHLKRLSPREKLRYILEKVKAIKTLIAAKIATAGASSRDIEFSMLLTLRAIQETNHQAYRYYRPKVYPSSITLFRPCEQPAGYDYDPQMGWGRLAAGGVEIHDIPGYSQSIIWVEPQVRFLAEQLRACLYRAQVTASSRGGSNEHGES